MKKDFCKKCLSTTEIEGFKIRVGAIYGRSGSDYFVCNRYDPDAKNLTIFVNGKSRIWYDQKISKGDFRYKLIAEAAKTQIPAKPARMPKQERIPGLPVMRKVNYNYTPSGMSTHSLIKQCFDNADHSGGGSNIQNENSYWAIYKDMPRRYVAYN